MIAKRSRNADGRLAPEEGISAPPQPHPRASISLRDGLRQTAVDLMALVRAIEAGVDLDGDGTDELRRDRVMVYAQSLGGIYSVMATAVDPKLDIAVFNVPGGPIAEIARLSPGFRGRVAQELKNRVPALLNGGWEGFTESLPLYLDPPVLHPAAGAVPIQQVLARITWLNRPGSPESFAPALRARPLAGNAPKAFFFQFAHGDRTVPNPASATLMRAAQARDLTTFYRNDLTPTASRGPHGFLLDPSVTGRQHAQLQVRDFLRSGGRDVIDPDGEAPVFEVPIATPELLERLNFTPPAAQGEPAPE